MRLVHWLLGLQDVRLDGEQAVVLEWQPPWPSWVLFCVILLAAFVVVHAYLRQPGRRWQRVALACVRGLAALVVVAVLCRPRLVLERTHVEPSVTALVLDSSASMGRQDLYLDDRERAGAESVAGKGRAGNLSRLDLARKALFAQGKTALADLVAAQEVVAYRADGDAVPVAVVQRGADASELIARIRQIEPAGESTNLAASLETVLDELRGRQLSAVVLVSDGRSTGPADFRPAVELANRRKIAIHTVPVGSTAPLTDVSVGPCEAEDRVFVHDVVAVTTRIEASGLEAPSPVTVELFEEGSAAPLATETVLVGGAVASTSVELRTRPRRPGRKRYEVRAAPLPAEQELSNNAETIYVEAIEDKLRVLYVDGYPRYEYRYLKNTLVREPTVISSCLLLSADEGFTQEGQEPIRRFPETADELNGYDVVILGDVDPRGDWLSDGQMQLLLDFVGQQGGGVGFVAGEAYSPRRFAGTPLEPLLPVVIDPSPSLRAGPDLMSGFRPRLTSAGKLSPILRLEADPARNVETFERLPRMYWFARTLGSKPGAEVLLEHPAEWATSGPMPIVAIGHYGAGRTFFQATDDTWRWRKGSGEGFCDAYWLHVARYLAHGKRAGSDRRFKLRTDKAAYAYGEPVRVSLSVLDSAVAARLPQQIEATVADTEGVPRARLLLASAAAGAGEHAGAVTFEAHFFPEDEGQLVVTAAPPVLAPGEREPTTTFRVTRRSLESRLPAPDHDVLRQLSAQTGGRVFALDEVEQIGRFVVDRSLEIPDDVIEPIWDCNLAVSLFALIMIIEWVARKLNGLV